MADSIVRLRVESQEYDAKLRRAVDGMRAFGEQCQKAGESVAKADKDTMDYVRAIGQMETVSKNMKGKISEMTTAFTELSVQYKQLTDEEKKSPFGQALSQSLDQLKTRINESKAQLQDVSAELGNTSAKGTETGGIMQQLAGKFTFTLDAVKLFNIGLKAAEGALNVAKDAFFASEATVDEWGRVMDSNRSLYEGFLNSINNGDISGFLSNISQIINAARAAYNELDRLGTMRTIQAPQISAQQTENDRIRQMIQTGRWISAPGKDSMGFKNGQLLTAPQIKALERMLNNGVQTVVNLTKNEVQQSGRAINAFYTRQSRELNMSEAEFRKGTSSMAEFDKRMAGYDAYKKWDAEAKTRFAQQGGRGFVNFDKQNPYAQYRRWGTFRVDGDRYNELVRLIQQRDQQTSSMYNMQGQAYRTMNRAEGVTLRGIMGGGGGGGRSGGGGGRGGGGGTHQETVEEKAAKLVANALENYENAINIAAMRFEMGMDNSEDMMKKELAARERLTMAYADAYNLAQSENYKTQFETEAGKYNQLADVVTGKRNLFNTATQDLIGMSVNPIEGVLKQLLGEDMQTYAKRKGIDLETESATEKEPGWLEKASSKLEKYLQPISSISSGLEDMGLKLPDSINRGIVVIQGLISVIEGVNALITLFSTSTQSLNTAAVTANTVALGTLTTAMVTNTATNFIPFLSGGGMAHAAGGLLAGHHFSMDQVPVMVNDGELILNRAQQGVIADAIGGSAPVIQIEGVIDGETIRLVQRNNNRRTGRGEYVTTKMR